MADRVPHGLQQRGRGRDRVRGVGPVQPQLAGQRGVAAQRRRVGGARPRRRIVEAAGGEHRAQRFVHDELRHIEIGEVTDRLQVRHIAFQRLDQRRLQRGVERRAPGTVVEVDDLLGQPAFLGHDAGGLQRLVVDEIGGVQLRLQEGAQHLRVRRRVGAAHHHTVQGGQVQLGPVVEQLGLALIDQQPRPGDELRKRLYLTGFQRRRPDLRLLVEHLDAGDAGPAQRAHQGAVAGRPDAGGDLGAGEVGQALGARIRGHHHHVEGALGVVAGDRDDLGAGQRVGLRLGAVDQHRIVAHRADVDLLGEHLRGDRGAGVVILPTHRVFGAGAGGDVGKAVFKVALCAQQRARGDGVDGLGLVSHHHVDHAG